MLKGVRKIKNDRVNTYSDRVKKVTLPEIRSQSPGPDPDFANISYQQTTEIKEAQFDAGIQKKLQRRIRQGQLTIEGRLDLHGCNQIQATNALNEFLRMALAAEFRMLIVIHGKGSRSESDSVLKPLVRHWLARQSTVLAWCPAQPKHGGEGASYIYLRSS